MKKIRTLLIIAILTLASTSSYAFENVIGISGGTNIGIGHISHSITTTNLQTKQDNIYTVNPAIKPFNSINASVEYQARFLDYILGVSLNNTNANYKTNLYDNNISLKTNSTDVSMEGFLRFINTRNFGLNVGGSLGIGYFIVDKNDKNNNVFNSDKTHQLYFIPRFIVDGEYKINKQFSLFGRVNATVPSLSDVYYDTNLRPSIPAGEMFKSSSKVNFDGIANFGFNIGIRYTL